MTIQEGQHVPGKTQFAVDIGFTEDLFNDYSYLWFKDGVLWLSFISSKQKGAFRTLMQNIEKLGLIWRIPTPMGRMVEIGIKQGWSLFIEYDEDMEDDLEYFTNEEETEDEYQERMLRESVCHSCGGTGGEGHVCEKCGGLGHD